MSSLLFLPEPSDLMWELAEDELEHGHQLLAPFALPEWPAHSVPGPLRRFAAARLGHPGVKLPGFTAAELGARAYARGRTDRMIASKLWLRRAAARWAGARRELRDSSVVMAPSMSALELFTDGANRRKVLVLDLPFMRRLHEDLDAAFASDPSCRYLNRYRAPDWALVRQESELRLADEVIVRGRYARDVLLEWGMPGSRVRLHQPRGAAVLDERERCGEGLHLMLAGLAAARHGTRCLQDVLDGRPWLHLYLRDGEGAEPRELFDHPQVHDARSVRLEDMDGLLAPALCESYFPELARARSLDLPIIASRPGAGPYGPRELYAELPIVNARALGLVIDSLRSAVQVRPELPLGSASLGRLVEGYTAIC